MYRFVLVPPSGVFTSDFSSITNKIAKQGTKEQHLFDSCLQGLESCEIKITGLSLCLLKAATFFLFFFPLETVPSFFSIQPFFCYFTFYINIDKDLCEINSLCLRCCNACESRDTINMRLLAIPHSWGVSRIANSISSPTCSATRHPAGHVNYCFFGIGEKILGINHKVSLYYSFYSI